MPRISHPRQNKKWFDFSDSSIICSVLCSFLFNLCVCFVLSDSFNIFSLLSKKKNSEILPPGLTREKFNQFLIRVNRFDYCWTSDLRSMTRLKIRPSHRKHSVLAILWSLFRTTFWIVCFLYSMTHFSCELNEHHDGVGRGGLRWLEWTNGARWGWIRVYSDLNSNCFRVSHFCIRHRMGWVTRRRHGSVQVNVV